MGSSWNVYWKRKKAIKLGERIIVEHIFQTMNCRLFDYKCFTEILSIIIQHFPRVISTIEVFFFFLNSVNQTKSTEQFVYVFTLRLSYTNGHTRQVAEIQNKLLLTQKHHLKIGVNEPKGPYVGLSEDR